MKTPYTLAIVFFCGCALMAQTQQAKPATQAVHPDYLAVLLKESNSLNAKAARLRLESQSCETVTKTEKLLEASRLEKQAALKQVEAGEINFSMNTGFYRENLAQVRKIRPLVAGSDNRMHIEFLIADSEKNHRLSQQMAEESRAQQKPALKLASLENAQDKILLALRQQHEIMELLPKKDRGIAQKP
jgi:hypothetical protein